MVFLEEGKSMVIWLQSQIIGLLQEQNFRYWEYQERNFLSSGKGKLLSNGIINTISLRMLDFLKDYPKLLCLNSAKSYKLVNANVEVFSLMTVLIETSYLVKKG